MNTLEIKGAYVSDPNIPFDADFDFSRDEGWEADDPSDVKFFLYLDIGEAGDIWSEHFSVLVVTPNNRPRNDPSARFLLVPYYSFSNLKEQLLKTLTACERDNWDACLDALRNCFRWEYD